MLYVRVLTVARAYHENGGETAQWRVFFSKYYFCAMLPIDNPWGSHSFRDVRRTSLSGFNNIMPDKTIRDTSYMGQGLAPIFSLSDTFTSDPDTSAEHISVSLFAKNTPNSESYVNELDLIFCDAQETVPASSRGRGRARVDIARFPGNTGYYPTSVTGSTGIGALTCYSLQAANYELAKYQFEFMRDAGAPLGRYDHALFIDWLPTVQEIYKRAIPIGIVGRENPLGSVSSNSSTYNPGGYSSGTRTDQEGKWISCVSSGFQDVKNLWGRLTMGASLGIALVLVDVPKDYGTHYARLSRGVPDSMPPIHHRRDNNSVTLTRTTFSDGPCGATRKYENDTTLGRQRKSYATNTIAFSEPSAYVFQWVPYVEDNYSTTRALLRQDIDVVRRDPTASENNRLGIAEFGPHKESILAGVSRHIGTTVHGRRGTDDNNAIVHRKYDAVDATDVLKFRAEMASPDGAFLFEFDTLTATRRLKELGDQDAYL